MDKSWKDIAKEKLVGRRIVRVSWENLFFMDEYNDNQILNLHLDNGEILSASSDEEGNRPGVIFTNKGRGMYSMKKRKINHNDLVPWFTEDHGTLPASYITSCREFFEWLDKSNQEGFRAPGHKPQATSDKD
jgi:hypothetical protein